MAAAALASEVNDQLTGKETLSERTKDPGSRIRGRVVSRGRGIGLAVKLKPRERRLARHNISSATVSEELGKLHEAVAVAVSQLEHLIENSAGNKADSANEILESQLLMLCNSSLVSKVESKIRDELLNVEWASKLTADDYLDQFQSLEDESLRDRSADVQDVFERIYDALLPGANTQTFAPDSVIVAAEIRPAHMIEIAKSHPAAIVVESGGWTSHAFILARELGIPAISGVRNAVHKIRTGTLLAVDAVDGIVFVDPSHEQQSHFASAITTIQSATFDDPPNASTTTRDGLEISIAANVDNVESCRHAIELGINEIGLVRSEYLFDVTRRLPDEAIQTEMYSKLSGLVGDRKIRIRTFDLSVGQLTPSRSYRETNPGLGLRSIRLSLRYENQFRAQLRSLIRANTKGNVEILIPLVAGVGDITRTRTILIEEHRKLNRSIADLEMPKLGAMIELPSAVLTIDAILKHADFVCIGTNDLVQYLVGVDRDNETVADWYETLHPSVLISIKMVVDAAKLSGRTVTVCGEMAGSAFYAPLLIGLGVTRISMSPISISSVSSHVRLVDSTKAKQLAKTALELATAVEIESKIRDFNEQVLVDSIQ